MVPREPVLFSFLSLVFLFFNPSLLLLLFQGPFLPRVLSLLLGYNLDSYSTPLPSYSLSSFLSRSPWVSSSVPSSRHLRRSLARAHRSTRSYVYNCLSPRRITSGIDVRSGEFYQRTGPVPGGLLLLPRGPLGILLSSRLSSPAPPHPSRITRLVPRNV